MKKALLYLLLLVFGVFSTYVLYVHGYIGLWKTGFINLGTMQILADLVIASTLIMFWMVADAPKHGMSAAPYVVLTLVAGSIGPLLYLVRREAVASAQSATATAYQP